jgi:hypothetical protein
MSIATLEGLSEGSTCSCILFIPLDFMAWDKHTITVGKQTAAWFLGFVFICSSHRAGEAGGLLSFLLGCLQSPEYDL